MLLRLCGAVTLMPGGTLCQLPTHISLQQRRGGHRTADAGGKSKAYQSTSTLCNVFTFEVTHGALA